MKGAQTLNHVQSSHRFGGNPHHIAVDTRDAQNFRLGCCQRQKNTCIHLPVSVGIMSMTEPCRGCSFPCNVVSSGICLPLWHAICMT